MNNFAINELARKDFFTALVMWIALELLCFWFLPSIKFIEPGDRLRGWLFTSIPCGIGGALLSAVSSRFLAIANDQDVRAGRDTKILVGQVMGGVGLLGVFLPFIMAIVEFFAKVQAQYR